MNEQESLKSNRANPKITQILVKNFIAAVYAYGHKGKYAYDEWQDKNSQQKNRNYF